MTVKELIEKLEEMPEDAIVEIYKNDEYLDDVEKVYLAYDGTVVIQNY